LLILYDATSIGVAQHERIDTQFSIDGGGEAQAQFQPRTTALHAIAELTPGAYPSPK
jgi:hypothetical protein